MVGLPTHRRRAQAFTTDLAVVGVVFGLAVVFDKVTGLSWTGLVLVAVAVWIYYVGVTSWLMDGQSAGKVIYGLQVRRRATGSAPRTLRGLLWSVGRHSLGYLVADVFLVGALLAFVDRRRRCLHDYAFASEVIVADGDDVLHGSFGDRYRNYWQRFSQRYDELNQRNRWFFFPWKWLSKAVVVAALVLDKLVPATQAPPSVAPAEPITPLGAKSAAGLWVSTTVASGIIVAGAWPTAPADLEVVLERGIVGQPETAEVYILRDGGSDLTQLTHNDAWEGDPHLSADRVIVFISMRDGNPDIYRMSADGSGETRLTTHQGDDDCPAWSPDGSRIAFQSDRDGNRDVYIMNADGSNQTRVTTDPAIDNCPTWSPDGERITFGSHRDGNWELYTTQVDGSGTRRLTNTQTTEWQPAWSPDGDQIAFMSDRDGNWDLYVMNADGTGTTQVTDHPGLEAEPHWAPSGHALLFTGDRGLEESGATEGYSLGTPWYGATEMYLIDLDGTNLTRVTSFNDCGPATSTCNPE